MQQVQETRRRYYQAHEVEIKAYQKAYRLKQLKQKFAWHLHHKFRKEHGQIYWEGLEDLENATTTKEVRIIMKEIFTVQEYQRVFEFL